MKTVTSELMEEAREALREHEERLLEEARAALQLERLRAAAQDAAQAAASGSWPSGGAALPQGSRGEARREEAGHVGNDGSDDEDEEDGGEDQAAGGRQLDDGSPAADTTGFRRGCSVGDGVAAGQEDADEESEAASARILPPAEQLLAAMHQSLHLEELPFWSTRTFAGLTTLDFQQTWEVKLCPFVYRGSWLMVSPASPRRFHSERAPCWRASAAPPTWMLRPGTVVVATGRGRWVCGRLFVETKRWLRAWTKADDLACGFVEGVWLQPMTCDAWQRGMCRSIDCQHRLTYNGIATAQFDKHIFGDATSMFRDDARATYWDVPEEMQGACLFAGPSAGLENGWVKVELDSQRGRFYAWSIDGAGGLEQLEEDGWEVVDGSMRVVAPQDAGGDLSGRVASSIRIYRREFSNSYDPNTIVIRLSGLWLGGICFQPTRAPRPECQPQYPAIEEIWAARVDAALVASEEAPEGCGAVHFTVRRTLPTGELAPPVVPVWTRRSMLARFTAEAPRAAPPGCSWAAAGLGAPSRPAGRSTLQPGTSISRAMKVERCFSVSYAQVKRGAVDCRFLEAPKFRLDDSLCPGPGRWVEVLVGRHAGEEAQVVETRRKQGKKYWRVRLSISKKLKWVDRVRDLEDDPPEPARVTYLPPDEVVPLALRGDMVEITGGPFEGRRGEVVNALLNDEQRPIDYRVKFQDSVDGVVRHTWTNSIWNVSHDVDHWREEVKHHPHLGPFEAHTEENWQAWLAEWLENRWRETYRPKPFALCCVLRANIRARVFERECQWEENHNWTLTILKPGETAKVLEYGTESSRLRVLILAERSRLYSEGWLDPTQEGGEPSVVLVEYGSAEALEEQLHAERREWFATFRRRWLKRTWARWFGPEHQAKFQLARRQMEERDAERSAVEVRAALEETVAIRGCPPGGPRPHGARMPFPAGIEEPQLFEAVVWVRLLSKAHRDSHLALQERKFLAEYEALGLERPSATTEVSSDDDLPEPGAMRGATSSRGGNSRTLHGVTFEDTVENRTARIKKACLGGSETAAWMQKQDGAHFQVLSHMRLVLATEGRRVE